MKFCCRRQIYVVLTISSTNLYYCLWLFCQYIVQIQIEIHIDFIRIFSSKLFLTFKIFDNKVFEISMYKQTMKTRTFDWINIYFIAFLQVEINNLVFEMYFGVWLDYWVVKLFGLAEKGAKYQYFNNVYSEECTVLQIISERTSLVLLIMVIWLYKFFYLLLLWKLNDHNFNRPDWNLTHYLLVIIFLHVFFVYFLHSYRNQIENHIEFLFLWWYK